MTALRALGASYPRHAVLAALVAGLLLGPRAPAAVVAAVALLAPLVCPRRALAAAVAVAVVAGAWAGEARTRALERSALAARTGALLRARATVLEPARRSPWGGWSAIARVRGEPVLLRAPSGVPAPEVGEVLGVSGRLRPASPYARARRAHVELRAGEVRRTGLRRGGVAGVVDAVRRRAVAALAGLPPPEAGLLRGMVLGDDSGLPDGVRDDFRAAGLTHLVAASGANVALLAALALGAAALLGVPFTARWLAVLALIALYVPLAGGGPSIRRAGVMGAAAVAAALAGRPSSRWYALGLAAAVTLALDPRSAGDPGWQLSFAAVGALLWRAGAWRERLAARAVPPGLAEAVAVTGAATLATAPVLALRLGTASLVSLPANVLAAPLVAPVMWLGFLAAALGQVAAGLGAPLVALAGPPLGVLVTIAHAAAGVPHATVATGPLPVAGACAVAVAVVERRAIARRLPWARPRLRGPLRAGTAAAAVALLALLALAAAQALRGGAPAPPRHLRVTLLDVGQGDATLLEDAGAAMLVDAGPPDGHVVDRLRDAGVRRLDVLVVTHAQADHEGGAAAVLRALPVGLLLDGRDGVPPPLGTELAAAATARGVRRAVPTAGMLVRSGRLALRVLGPPPAAAGARVGEDPNARAVVAELRDGAARVLLTADAESDVLDTLALDGPVDVLKVAHHGSADPGLPALLARLRPRIAGIEVGAHNGYGHPAPSTLDALRGVARVVRTDRDGTVRLDRTPAGWEVRTGL